MSPNKSKLKDKSSGEGVTSYRITSYLTLSQATINKKAEAKGEEVAEEGSADIFNEGVLVATDFDAPAATHKKIKKVRLLNVDLLQYNKSKIILQISKIWLLIPLCILSGYWLSILISF